MDKKYLIARIIIKIMIGIGLLCSFLSGIAVIVLGVMDIAVPKFVAILFCVGCFVSAGVNLCNYIRVKKQQKS